MVRQAFVRLTGPGDLLFTGWLAVHIRIRLDQYEMLLTESLESTVED